MKSKLSEHFWRTRLAKGLRFGQLARQCGYKNISKGSRKIQEFEQGGSIQEDLLLKLADALGIDGATVASLIDEDRRLWNHWANEPVRPYIVLRLMAAIYSTVPIPDDIQTAAEAEAYASALSKERHMRCCLVLSRRISVWFREDGSVEHVTETMPGQPNSPYMQIGGKNCLLKPVDHGLALQQIHWPKKQVVVTDFGGGVRFAAASRLLRKSRAK